MAKKIFINGSMITKQPTGVAVHNINVLKYLLPRLEQEGIFYVVYAYEPSLIDDCSSCDFVRKITLGPLLDKILIRFQSIHRIVWNLFFLNRLSREFDIIYSLSTYGSLSNKKQIITVHDLICLTYPKQHILQYIYFKFFVPHILKNAKKIISISNFTQSEIVKFYPFINEDKIEVIYNGVDHIKDNSTIESDLFVEKFTKGKAYCFSVGCSYPHKNGEKILELAGLIKNEDLYFVIAGKKTKYFLGLQKIARKKKLLNVLFIDYLSDSLLSSFYKSSNLHLYLSKYEGFGFPPAEASFFGTNSFLIKNKINQELYDEIFTLIDSGNEILSEKIVCSTIHENKNIDGKFDMLQKKFNWEANAERLKVILTF